VIPLLKFVLAFLVLSAWGFWNYRFGFKVGYSMGKKAESKWWTGIEEEVEFTRPSLMLGRDPAKSRSRDAS
jgi:hypothetical protein